MFILQKLKNFLPQKTFLSSTVLLFFSRCNKQNKSKQLLMFQEKEEFFLVTIHALSYHQFCSVFSCVCVIYLDFLWIFLFSVDLGDFQKKPKFTDFSTSCSKCFWKDLRWFHCDLAILWFFAVWKICGSLRFVAGKITLAICWIFCGQKDFIFVPIFRDHKIHEKQITKNPTLILLFLHFGFLRIYLVLWADQLTTQRKNNNFQFWR